MAMILSRICIMSLQPGQHEVEEERGRGVNKCA